MATAVATAPRGPPTLITGNAGKMAEFTRLWPGIRFKSVDLPEIQGDPVAVAVAKMEAAVALFPGEDIIVEDSSLCYNAMGGLPGVYVKWFLAKVGLMGLYNMLAGYEDKSAYGQCLIVRNFGGRFGIYQGRVDGRVVQPRGDNGFGWDAVFEPNPPSDAQRQTYAEMSPERKDKVSDRAMAIRAAQCAEET